MDPQTKKFLTCSPGDMIRMSLEDLDAVRLDPKFDINMREWVWPGDGRCLVCHAGAVAVNRFGLDGTTYWHPQRFQFNGLTSEENWEAQQRLDAINYFRLGNLWAGLYAMKVYLQYDASQTALRREIYYDPQFPETYKKQMLELADYLDSIHVPVPA